MTCPTPQSSAFSPSRPSTRYPTTASTVSDSSASEVPSGTLSSARPAADSPASRKPRASRLRLSIWHSPFFLCSFYHGAAVLASAVEKCYNKRSFVGKKGS